VGIGDDAAVIDPPSSKPPERQLVACTDQIIDGVDFELSQLQEQGKPLADIGFKAMAINLSDIAAMGAEPSSALVTLTLPHQDATRIAGEVYEGIVEAAEKYEIAIAGGDISTYDGPLAISVTLLGEVATNRSWLRSGAQEGDAILVTGPVGGSILGRHLRPTPRLDLVKPLRERVNVTAAIDISDGLSLDLDRLCAASSLGAELDTDKIPIPPDAEQLAQQTGHTPSEHAWRDGEDFELIVTMSQSDAEAITRDQTRGLVQIGTVTGRTGLWQRQKGKVVRLSPQGYLH